MTANLPPQIQLESIDRKKGYYNPFLLNSISHSKNDDIRTIQSKSEDIKNIISLKKRFLDKLKHHDNIDRNLKEKVASEIAPLITMSNSTKITFEVTPEESFLVKAKYNEIDYFLAIYFDEEISNGYECFMNLYLGKKNVDDFSGSLDSVFLSLINR